jgi:hypothetical protein
VNEREFYRKLVDMYAGRELPQELEDEMEWKSFGDAELSHDMATLRKTVDLLQSLEAVEFTQESYQRVLMKLYARTGVELQQPTPDPTHLQYPLPMQG